MPRVLILSSFVAASRVGGGAQVLALARLGIEAVLVPTVLFGRHPGLGPPGGTAVDPDAFEAILGGVEAQGVFPQFGAVIAGYFSSAEQVAVAAEALARVRAASPAARLVVDPIMGDADKGLYVREAVAEAIAAELVPMADLVTPNTWELGRLTSQDVTDVAGVVRAARSLGRPALVSSVTVGAKLGVLFVDTHQAWLATHAAAPVAPKGAGDLLSVLFVAALLRNTIEVDALAAATGAVAEAIAATGNADDIPLASLPTDLHASGRVKIEPVRG